MEGLLGPWWTVFGSVLDAKRLPRGGPRGSQMELKRRVAQKSVNAASTSMFIVSVLLLIVDVWSIWRPKSIYKRILRAILLV